jgi:hypothetical protein
LRKSSLTHPARLRSHFGRASSTSARFARRRTQLRASPTREVCLDEACARASEGGPQFPLAAVDSKVAASAYIVFHPKAFPPNCQSISTARKMPQPIDIRGMGARFVYILRSDSSPSRHYVGRRVNVDERLEWHTRARAATRSNIAPGRSSCRWSSQTNVLPRTSRSTSSPAPAAHSRSVISRMRPMGVRILNTQPKLSELPVLNSTAATNNGFKRRAHD